MKFVAEMDLLDLVSDLENDAKRDGVNKHVGGAIPIFNDGLVLLKRVPEETFLPNYWELPSGGREIEDVSLLQVVKRELYEETGLIYDGVIAYLGYFDYKTKSYSKVRQWNFIVSVKGESILLSSVEHDDFMIIKSRQQLVNLLITKESKRVAEEALEKLGLV